MTTNQPTEDRLSRLESAVLTLTEEVRTVNQNINRLAEQAADDRQAWQAETNRIWNYLMGHNPNNGQSDMDIE